MNEEDLDFLALIPSTEPFTFNELCGALGDDCPREKAEWRALFTRLDGFESEGYLEVSRVAGKIDGVQLTECGAALIRDRNDKKRGLLGLL
jgi:hypothetical protein